ncbi:MAG: hypothetical protein IKZ88_06775 [Neisseriaceae bacterium]|nr:hypothetical protein [Neisseriaceae bacterium]
MLKNKTPTVVGVFFRLPEKLPKRRRVGLRPTITDKMISGCLKIQKKRVGNKLPTLRLYFIVGSYQNHTALKRLAVLFI